VELLVVVGIIAILLGVLSPILLKAMFLARREAGCRANVRRIAGACYQYAFASRRRFLPIGGPAAGFPDANNWGNMLNGNPACLWLLVKYDYCGRSTFLCPGAMNDRNWEAPPLDANNFSATNFVATRGMSTLSYSYVSMCNMPSWSAKLTTKMTAEQLEPTFVVLADQNPRCDPGVTKVYDYRDTDHNDAIDSANVLARLGSTVKNSLNHQRTGQNVGRVDGSAVWMLDPNAEGGDDIFSSKSSGEANGQRDGNSPTGDTFLIP